MSTDLEFLPITIHQQQQQQQYHRITSLHHIMPSPSSDPHLITVISHDHHDDINGSNNNNNNKESNNHEDEAQAQAQGRRCPRTPTAVEHRIPAPSSPPPAPRKRTRVGNTEPPCKRRLRFDFFDNDQEIQEFFAAGFDQIQSRRFLKRRCLLQLA